MPERRPRSLPVFRPVPDLPQTPKVDEVRRRLGGRADSGPRIGEVVRVEVSGERVCGVILANSGERCDVWLGAGAVRRVPPEEAVAFAGEITPSLRAIASDITIFASLAEGQRVVASLDGEHVEVTLAEKCRFGALVVRDDAVLMGVGFRMLTPAGGTPC